MKNGKGKIEIKGYYIYVGDWKNDKKDGKGKQTWIPDCSWAGDEYEGDFN